jgi:hypothetical protein
MFVATYKFALLHTLADLAVLKGNDMGAPLDLDTKDIAAKIVELYWRQCRPFQIGGENPGLVLQQNTGKQAAIISQIVESQQECEGSLFRLKQIAAAQWSSLVNEVDQVVRVMPLWKLQTVGDERLAFLYDNLDRGTKITLKPGVAYCLRAFYELLRDMIQGAWVRFVQKLNANRLGNITDLGSAIYYSGGVATARPSTAGRENAVIFARPAPALPRPGARGRRAGGWCLAPGHPVEHAAKRPVPRSLPGSWSERQPQSRYHPSY